jgi:hypothetical protein
LPGREITEVAAAAELGRSGEGGRASVKANPFPRWLPEVAADAVVVQPDDFITEARGNLWTFGLDDEQRAAVTPAEIEAFVRAVALARGRWLTARGARSMRFYCWYDAMAGQLRLSLVSVGSGQLPFKCPVEPTAELGEVIEDFLKSVALVPPTPLPVWVAVVP